MAGSTVENAKQGTGRHPGVDADDAQGRQDGEDVRHERNGHPTVSESHDGSPAYAWSMAAAVGVSGLLAVLGYMTAATAVIVVAALVSGILRLTLRDRSPWRVRSVVGDAVIGIGLGIGLIMLYVSLLMLG